MNHASYRPEASLEESEAAYEGRNLKGPPAERPVMGAVSFEVGTKVSHPMFGDGTVLAVEEGKLIIKFKDGRVKKIVDYYVKRRR